jgi:uncharacterized membrane protein YdjX (TVP38/TMEM64 family)
VSRTKLSVLLALVLAVTAFFALGLQRYFSIDAFRAQRAVIDAYVDASPAKAGLLFFLAYVAITGLSLPGAAVMTLIAGALFGVVRGTIIVSFASAVGATIAFLASRFLLRDWVQRKFGERLRAIDAGVDREGAFYLFALRLVPVFPFFMINLLMGLTSIRTWTFYWVSQAGMLAGTIVYVYAGTQLGQFQISWQLLLAFSLLGVFPLAAKKLVDEEPKGLLPLGEAAQVRSQHHRDRSRLGRPCQCVHRSSGQSKSHAHRKRSYGWRLSQHRVRSFQSPDPHGQTARGHSSCERIWFALGKRRL